MPKILVIEDNTDIQQEVIGWLQFENYEAIGASNGREGLDLAFQHLPDLILSDILMPQMDGYQVLYELRIHPETALIPFIFVTAKSERHELRYAMELGADDYISKPFTVDELLQAVQKRLQRHTGYQHSADQQVLTERQRMFRTLPHELQTPLVGVLGIGELLQQNAHTLTAENIREYGELLTMSAQRLYHVTENFLLYTKLETIAQNPSEMTPDAPVKAEEIRSITHNICEQIASNYQRTSDLSCGVESCALRIEQSALRKILFELVDNAFKFSKPGQGVRVQGGVREGSYHLTVSDHGRGITSENRSRLGAFVQFERSVYEQQGLGLGLFIAQRLVENSGGQLTIESTVDEGTTVSVSLPVA
ncbi:MAG: hybrid sensor histidine kinase/response regulator [Anaerolineae bacterium]